MNELIESLERRQVRQIPDFRVGDRVRVHFQVVEGSRKRTQVFEGVVLKEKGGGPQRTFTVRKLSFGVGVERTFPVHSPKIERIEVVGRGEVRRAKLYYLRGRVGRRARLREMRDFRPEDVGMVGAGAVPEAPGDGAAAEAAPEGDGEPGAAPGAEAEAPAPEPEAEAPGAEEEAAAAEPAEPEPEPEGESQPEAEAEPEGEPEPEGQAEPQGGEEPEPGGEGDDEAPAADAEPAEEPEDQPEPAAGGKQGQSA